MSIGVNKRFKENDVGCDDKRDLGRKQFVFHELN